MSKHIFLRLRKGLDSWDFGVSSISLAPSFLCPCVATALVQHRNLVSQRQLPAGLREPLGHVKDNIHDSCWLSWWVAGIIPGTWAQSLGTHGGSIQTVLFENVCHGWVSFWMQVQAH
jgi:hypothetical protein